MTIEKTGKTVEDALEEALKELQLTKDQVDVEILEEPKKAILGIIGGRKARVKVTPKAAPAPEAPKVETPAPVAEASKVEAPKAETTKAATPAPEKVRKENDGKAYLVDENAIEEAKKFLNEIFAAMKITVNTEKFINRTNGMITLKLHGDDMGILIGKHGQTLDALQYLTNLVANRAAQGHMRIIIDVEDYRDRREETLNRLARRLAEKVKRTGERCVLEPMNPHERKIIHTALQGDPTITTLSEGTDPYRKVVIELKK
jgi:spoIIIJ-associated protein